MVVSCEMIFCCKVKDNIGKMQIKWQNNQEFTAITILARAFRDGQEDRHRMIWNGGFAWLYSPILI